MSSFLKKLTSISDLPYNKLTVIVGKPGSGKTTVAGTYPKPMLYISIGNDGGGVVLKEYGDSISTLQLHPQNNKAIYHQLVDVLKELGSTEHNFKTILIDAYSSIEEDLVLTSERIKGKKLSLDERGAIGTMMTKMRDMLVDLSQKDSEYVLITHIKNKEDVDNVSGEKTIHIIPKMTYNNGNILLERASNVMYCARKPVRNDDGTVEVKFLTYVGAHPYIDTKLRVNGGKMSSVGTYIENATYDDINKLINGEETKKVNVVDTPLDKNPFDENNKEEW